MFTIEEGRRGVVVTLLAILELVKEQLLDLVQAEAFAPIHVKAASSQNGVHHDDAIDGFFAAESNGAILALVGFLAFRFFDILKPPPCRRLDKLVAGLGILPDDLMAGVYAAIVLQIYIYFGWCF